MRFRTYRVRLRAPGVVLVLVLLGSGLATLASLAAEDPEPPVSGDPLMTEIVFSPRSFGRLEFLPIDTDPSRDAAPVVPASTEATPAPEPKRSFRLTTEAPAKVSLGGRIDVLIRLENTGDEPLEVPSLVEDRQVISFDLSLDDAEYVPFQRIHSEPQGTDPREWPMMRLDPGESRELLIQLPAIVVGKLRLITHFGRALGAEGTLAPWYRQANQVEVVIEPTGGSQAMGLAFQTSMGPIEVELYPRDALATSLHVARLVEERFYDGLTFHRIVPDFVIQGGCPQANGLGGPGYSIPAEFPKAPIAEHLLHRAGTVAIARGQQEDSGGSQLYITVGEAPHIDGQYAVFGQVTRGLGVVQQISEVALQPSTEKPIDPILFEWASLRHP